MGKDLGGVVMGVAISSMHYTGMSPARFATSNLTVDISRALTVSRIGIAGIVIVTLMTLGFTLLTTIMGGQFAAQTLRSWASGRRST
jgi:NO-binding membrane sensor protein with MHYT domain